MHKRSLSRAICAAGLLLVAILTISGTAVAGFKNSGSGVIIDLPNRAAQGDLGVVRSTPDTSQYIHCSTQANRFGTTISEHVLCLAVGPTGVQLSCYATEPAMVNAARALDGESSIYFSADTTGKCTTIFVNHSSYAAPKLP